MYIYYAIYLLHLIYEGMYLSVLSSHQPSPGIDLYIHSQLFEQ